MYGINQGVPPLSSTSGLRKATIVLFWCTVGSTVLLAFACLNRRSVWDEFRDGTSSFNDLQNADDTAAAAAFVEILLTIATVIVLSMWSLRTVRNARSLGATDVSPGLACGGWYIPFGNLVVPFVQLRRAARRRLQPTTSVSVWQGLFIGAAIVSALFRSLGDIELAEDADDLSSRLTAQTVLAFVLAVVLAVMAVFATRAMREVDGG